MEAKVTRSGRMYCTPDAKHSIKLHDVKSNSKSAKKKLVLFDQPSELSISSLTDELILEEICRLSPLSPTRQCKENIKPSPTKCISLASPLRSLSLSSSGKKCSTVLKKFNDVNLVKEISSPKHTQQKEVIKSPRKRVHRQERSVHQTFFDKQSPTVLKDILNSSPVKESSILTATFPSPSKKSRSLDSSPVLKNGIDSSSNHSSKNDNILTSAVKAEDSIYNEVKNALHISVPNQLVGRDSEITEISSFIEECVISHTAKSLYISGAPGTGKTACLYHVLSSTEVAHIVSKQITVNCMALRTSHKIYQRVAMEMGATHIQSKTHQLSLKFIEKNLIKDGPMILLLLDEMDQLESKYQEVLYTMFGWSSLSKSRIILVGIANSLDLTDRILPRLQANVQCKPKLLNFKPYNKDQLVEILEARICQTAAVHKNSSVIDKMAMQFCARKVAAMSGDARKALDICRRAVEVAEINTTKTSSTEPAACQKVGILQISNIISGVYQSTSLCKLNVNAESEDTFPLQQKLVVCTLILICKKIKCKEPTLGKLHDSYARICKKRQVPPVCQSEFVSLCDLVEARGIIAVKKSKQVRQSKVKLSIQEDEVEFAFKGKALLSSILQEGL